MSIHFETKSPVTVDGGQEISAGKTQEIKELASCAVSLVQSMQSLGNRSDVFEIIETSTAMKQLSVAERALFDKVFGSMLSQLSSGFAVAAGVGKSAVPHPVSVKPLNPEQLFVENLPEDIQGRMEQAVLDSFGRTKGKIDARVRGGIYGAVSHFSMLGVGKSEITQRVRDKLSKHLTELASGGLSSKLEFGARIRQQLLSDKLRNPKVDAQSVTEMFGLEEIGEAMGEAGVTAGHKAESYYSTAMYDGYILAQRFGLQNYADQYIVNLVQDDNIIDAARALEKAEAGDIAMLNIAAFGMQKYLQGSKFPSAFCIIEALKRVQGELKPTASLMLKELAKGLYKSGDALAFKALRARGRVIDKIEEDSTRTDFITTVTGEEEKADIVTLAKAAILNGIPSYKYLYQMVKALEACQAYDVISQIGHWLLRVVDGNTSTNPVNEYSRIADIFARAFDKEGLEALVGQAEGDTRMHQQEDWGIPGQRLTHLMHKAKSLKAAIQEGPKEPVVNHEAFTKPDLTKRSFSRQKEFEADLHTRLTAAGAKTPHERLALIAEAEVLMTKAQFFAAQLKSIEAGDRAGILRACDALLEVGQGTGAKQGLMAAAMLQA